MRPAEAIAARLAGGGTVLLDGATGTELQRRDVPMDDAAWCALAALTHPDTLRAVHEDYVRLGCDVITTNTFASARHLMARAGREDDTKLGYRRAVEIAREARERAAAGRPVAVAGSISTMRPARKGRWQGFLRNPHPVRAGGAAGLGGLNWSGSSKGSGAGGLLRSSS
jgi:S-methylmethionine-dependent homocysteine/selenocysteine methylase